MLRRVLRAAVPVLAALAVGVGFYLLFLIAIGDGGSDDPDDGSRPGTAPTAQADVVPVPPSSPRPRGTFVDAG